MRKSTTDEQSPAFQFYANDWISDPSRLKLFSRKTKDEKFTFFDAMVRMNKTAENIGVSNHKLDGTW